MCFPTETLENVKLCKWWLQGKKNPIFLSPEMSQQQDSPKDLVCFLPNILSHTPLLTWFATPGRGWIGVTMESGVNSSIETGNCSSGPWTAPGFGLLVETGESYQPMALLPPFWWQSFLPLVGLAPATTERSTPELVLWTITTLWGLEDESENPKYPGMLSIWTNARRKGKPNCHLLG